MRVLFVVRNIVYAGASKMAVLVINELQRRGHEVGVLTYNNDKIGLTLEDGVIFFRGRINPRLAEYFYAIRKIRHVAKDFQPDVVVGFRDNASALSIVATSGLKIPVVVCERSDPYMETNLSLRISRQTFRWAAGGIFQTSGAYKYFEKMVHNYTIIPNPVMPTIYVCTQPFSERENEIVNVARLVLSQKRQDVLLQAMTIVVKSYPNIRLSLFGDGIDRLKLETMAIDLGLKDNVVFHGVVRGVQERLVRAKMFVLSSDYEGISNALIEAMTVGLPCVSTDTSPGGTRVLINDGESGFIVPMRNPKALAEKILFYLNHPEIADKHGENAKKIALKYSPNNIFQMWESFLQTIVDKNRK